MHLEFDVSNLDDDCIWAHIAEEDGRNRCPEKIALRSASYVFFYWVLLAQWNHIGGTYSRHGRVEKYVHRFGTKPLELKESTRQA